MADQKQVRQHRHGKPFLFTIRYFCISRIDRVEQLRQNNIRVGGDNFGLRGHGSGQRNRRRGGRGVFVEIYRPFRQLLHPCYRLYKHLSESAYNRRYSLIRRIGPKALIENVLCRALPFGEYPMQT